MDDSFFYREAIGAILREQGYDTHCIGDGAMALKLIPALLPDLVLLDAHMPGLDGYEVCRQIKSTPQTHHIPIIFVSTSKAAGDRVKAFEVGGVDYLTKPFELEETLLRIRNQLEIQNTQKHLNEVNSDLEQRVFKRTLQLKTVHNRLKASEERLENILETLQDIVWSAAIEPFQILYLNPAAAKIYHRPLEDFLKDSRLWFEVIHPDDRPEVVECMNSLTSRGSIDIEYRIVWPNGQVRWVKNRSHIVVGEDDMASIRVEGLVTDISDRKRAEVQLIHDALHDGLTQLPNRTLFVDRLETALARKHRSPNYGFAVLFLDLDRFKVVNDSLGHAAGDQLLIEVANRLLGCVSAGDTVARLGGDEFTILLDDVDATVEAITCVQKIQAALSQPAKINGTTVFTGCSIGIVVATTAYTAGLDLLRDADIAMYRAKESHQSSYEVFDLEMHARLMRRLKLEHDMHVGLENREFKLVYQPIVALKTEAIVGFEALVRWDNPKEGVINPTEFIPIAEETGFIIPLGEWILAEACRHLKQWQQIAPRFRHLRVNVNIAGSQLWDPELLSKLDQILIDVGLSGHYLRLEMTETTLIEQTEKVVSVLRQIRQRGVQLSIDDFGTGYSSLSYLSRLPIDNLKIDQSFVSRMHLEADSLEIVRTITALAQTLGMDVTAEGIELEVQLYLLKELNSEFGQGYYFSKPLSAEAIATLLRECPQGRPAPQVMT
ncbi:MAG: EAL domain-containing protein [Leptolyngbyaceae cyanobacterium]